MAATVAGFSFTLVAAAAQEFGLPRIVWGGAAIVGSTTLAIVLVLFFNGSLTRQRRILSGEPLPPGKLLSLRERPEPRMRGPQVVMPRVFAPAIAIAGLAVFTIMVANGLGLGSSAPQAVIVCIDRGKAKAAAKSHYLEDLRSVVHEAAADHARLYADECGANSTGTVDWPVNRTFPPRARGLQTRKVDGRLEAMARTPSRSKAAPLGEILVVMARQCHQAGGSCLLYVFSDGEWSDDFLKVRDGVGRGERQRYLRLFLPRIEGLAGSEVDFVGIGLGTSSNGLWISGAREVASQLVEGAGGKMGVFAARL